MKRVRDLYGLTNLQLMIPMLRTIDEAKRCLKEMENNGMMPKPCVITTYHFFYRDLSKRRIESNGDVRSAVKLYTCRTIP